jgi:RpiB/LacA/LacB family sugar-phosphate isomerase
MKLAIAGDSAGLPLVATLLPHLRARAGLEVCDLSQAPDGTKEFYANLAERVALAVRSGEYNRGILICGTGIGVAMSANKVPGIRAAQTHDPYSAERAAKSNNAHIITLGARVVGSELAKTIVDAWLAAEFDPAGASVDNVNAIEALDAKYHP